MKRKGGSIRRLVRENLNLLTENVVCSTKTILCPCEHSLPSQQGTCEGTRTIYCSGAYTDDCMCCGGEMQTGGGYLDPIYKKRRY
tara:strand:+ start:832 stop:1086 length:255 start_codon:yes stop_codon:yes gene_type:complete